MAITTTENRRLDRSWTVSERVKALRLLSIRIGGIGKVPPDEVIFFMDQLSLMLETGTPLNKSIQAIGLQIKNSEFKRAVQGVENGIEEGCLLSDAMGKYPRIFSTIHTSMIRAGESGTVYHCVCIPQVWRDV